MTTLLSSTATARAIERVAELTEAATRYTEAAAVLDSLGMWTAADFSRRSAATITTEADRIAADLLVLISR